MRLVEGGGKNSLSLVLRFIDPLSYYIIYIISKKLLKKHLFGLVRSLNENNV